MRHQLNGPTTLVAPGPRRRAKTTANIRLPICISVAEPNEPMAFASRSNQRRCDLVTQELNAVQPAVLLPSPEIDSESLAVVRTLIEQDKEASRELSRISEVELSDDELSYEECLEISEALGDVKKDEWSLRAEQAIDSLDIELYCAPAKPTVNDDECACLVCLQQYETDEVLRKLPCGHSFHICCADQWLFQTNACPCCRKPIDGPR